MQKRKQYTDVKMRTKKKVDLNWQGRTTQPNEISSLLEREALNICTEQSDASH